MKRVRSRHLIVWDAALMTVAPFVAYATRYEHFTWTADVAQTARVYVAISVPLGLALMLASGLYRHLWRYASVTELRALLLAGLFASVGSTIVGITLPIAGLAATRVPYSVLLLNAFFTLAIIATPRLLLRAGSGVPRSRRRSPSPASPVLIVGAGIAGQMVVKELLTSDAINMYPIGFIDDDPDKRGHRLSNVPVLGSVSELGDIVRREGVDTVIVAMPSAGGQTVREIVRRAAEAGAKTRTVPGLSEILSERVSVTALREVRIEDLLRREPIETNLTQVGGLASGKTVLVTGAGGSIGSELCRQLAALEPRRLVLLGHGENSIFEILHSLKRRFPEQAFEPVIADIRDASRIRAVFEQFRPDTVFHAAAHKHVPLMEGNVAEAILNNIWGTQTVVSAASACDTQHLVFISTDKAVRPTNVMGAAKRVAECVVHDAAVACGRPFVAVRFGNVLGSRGSVVPIFARQIREGGPVTLTDPGMRRYFMTIPEAVQLVLQAGALGQDGELFMLDMGQPIAILDLARDMIRLSGLKDGDIKIEFTGVRPGEKLTEEMFFSHELAEPTSHPKVLRARNGHGQQFQRGDIDHLVRRAREQAPAEELRGLLQLLVPDYVPSGAPYATRDLDPADGAPARARTERDPAHEGRVAESLLLR